MENKLKIFTQDQGWRGMIVVVAHNEEEAREYMKNCENYNSNYNFVEGHEIKEGFVYYNLGDS